LADGLFATQLDRVIAKILPAQGIILALHRLSSTREEGPLRGLSVSLAEFRASIDLLESCGFEFVSLNEAMARLESARAGSRFAVLTFDDGYVDNFTLLLPELERRKLPAVVYLTSGFIDRTEPMWWYGIEHLFSLNGSVAHGGRRFTDFSALHRTLLGEAPDKLSRSLDALRQRYDIDFNALTARWAMDWGMVRDLAASGLVEIGAHGVMHAPLSRLDDAQALREMQMSADRIARETGRAAVHFAFPFGDRGSVSRRDVALARQAGFATAVTSISGLVRSRHVDRHALRRVVLGGSGMEDRLRASLTGITSERPIVGRG
jgi:peptidoglycan/xylan/chitin deacetylase (PgdA/CDA1 family)